MSVQRVIDLCGRYNEEAQMLAAATHADSERVVNVNIFYHLPDSPHILNEFTWQTDDRFAKSDEISKDLSNTAKAFRCSVSLGENTVTDTLHFYLENLRKAYEHLKRMEQTADQFEIPFHQYSPNRHPELIEKVPFLRTRGFLGHWYHKIQGPLHTVVVGHSIPNERRAFV
jgi:uncharacterized protein Usg